MVEVEVNDAGQQLSVLVSKAREGEDIVLTEGGLPVARVTPTSITVTEADRATAFDAFKNIRALAAEVNLGPFDIEQFKKDRDFGRR